jgi:hypothetical protein
MTYLQSTPRKKTYRFKLFIEILRQQKLINNPPFFFHRNFLLMTSEKILVVISMMINHESMVSGFPQANRRNSRKIEVEKLKS